MKDRLLRSLGGIEVAIVLFSVVMFIAVASGAPEAGVGSQVAEAGSFSLLQAAAVLGPLAVSPFLALAFLGIAQFAEVATLPAGLALFGHPLAIIVTAGLAALLHGGRSSKLSKPLAEGLGAFESLFAVVVVVGLAAGLPASFGTGPSLGFGLLAVLGVSALMVLRTAIDVVVWLSPIPFVDGLFQTAKGLLTGFLVAAALVAPVAAVVLNLVLLVVTFGLVRWAIRTARFGLIVAKDLVRITFGNGERIVLPRDAMVPDDLGPFSAFAIAVDGRPRRSLTELELRAGRWFLVDGASDVPVGDAVEVDLVPKWSGLEFRLGSTVLLLPPRYRHLGHPIVGAGGARALAETVKARRQLRPSLL